MRTAAAAFTGTHDFAAFRSAGHGTTETVRTITRSELAADTASGWDDTSRGTLLVYEVSGDGFLHHMVRAIVGTLVEIGRGRRPAASMAALLAAARRRAPRLRRRACSWSGWNMINGRRRESQGWPLRSQSTA